MTFSLSRKKMVRTTKKWTNRVKVFKTVKIDDLESALNEFFDSGKFIIETQLFPLAGFNNSIFDIVIHFRIPLDQ